MPFPRHSVAVNEDFVGDSVCPGKQFMELMPGALTGMIEAPPGLTLPSPQDSEDHDRSPSMTEPAFVSLASLAHHLLVPAEAAKGPRTATKKMRPAVQQPAAGRPATRAEEPTSASGSGVPAPTPMPLLDASMTTLVVQNLPGRYTREDVLKTWPVDGSYDYMHLPYNLLQKRPLGYFFINFKTHELAAAFQQKWHGKALPNGGNRKPLDIGHAEVQGRQANLELLKTRKIGHLEKAGFLPLVLRGTTVLDCKGILMEQAEMRSSKGKKLNGTASCQTPPQDPESDVPTTASSPDARSCGQQSSEDASPREVRNSKVWCEDPSGPMYVSCGGLGA